MDNFCSASPVARMTFGLSAGEGKFDNRLMLHEHSSSDLKTMVFSPCVRGLQTSSYHVHIYKWNPGVVEQKVTNKHDHDIWTDPMNRKRNVGLTNKLTRGSAFLRPPGVRLVKDVLRCS